MTLQEDIKKSHNDFSYFCEKFIKIVHPTRGLVPFELHPFQKRLVQEFEDNRFVIATKFRQGGFSTTTVMYALWRCLFHCDQRILFVTKTDWEARGLNHIFRKAFNLLPDEWRTAWEVGRCNDHEVEFKATGSQVWFSTPTACCSRAMTHLIIDEAAFIPDMDRHWAAMWPVLATGGSCFAISSVNGMGNWFHKIYTAAVEKQNAFKVFECNYKEHPTFTPEFIEHIKGNLGPRGFAQEIECNFLDGRHQNSDTTPKKRKPKEIKREILNLVVELLEYYDDDGENSQTTGRES